MDTATSPVDLSDEVAVVRDRTYTLVRPSISDDGDEILETGVPEVLLRERYTYWQDKFRIVKGDDRFWPPPYINVFRDGTQIGVALIHDASLEGEVALGSDFISGVPVGPSLDSHDEQQED